MKWIFLLGLLVFTPAVTFYLRANRSKLPIALFLISFLPFIEARFNISASPIAWPDWQGIVKGATLSPVDALAIAVILTTSSIRSPLRLKLAFAAVVGAYVLSTAMSPAFTPPMFYGVQLARCFLVFFAVARACAYDRRCANALLAGMFAGLIIQGGVVITQYLGGAVQAPGWFGHQNSLGMVAHLIVYAAFAMFLGGHMRKLSGVAVVAGLIVAYGGGSRATIAFMLVGLGLTFLLSSMRQWTGRKARLAGMGFLAALVVLPAMYSAIERRPEEQRLSSVDLRERMNNAAMMMVSDHPLGVGANRYVVVVNMGGYSARANVEWTSSAAPVHNSYYLITAEMGWPGLFANVLFLLVAVTVALKVRKRAPPGFTADLACGVAVAITMFAIHSYWEWISLTYPSQIFLSMNVGLAAAAMQSLSRGATVSRPAAIRRAARLPVPRAAEAEA